LSTLLSLVVLLVVLETVVVEVPAVLELPPT
jgi:hypothetical protein